MTNAEKYKDRLRFILGSHNLIAVVDGKPEACGGVLNCMECLFFYLSAPDCNQQAIEWLLEECGE